MKILKNKRTGHTVALNIEESHESFETMKKTTFKRIVKKANVPGFRQGKANLAAFERHFGAEYLTQETVFDVVNKAYSEAIQELSLDVVDYPKNMDVTPYKEGAAITFSCDVDVEPEVKLGKYKGVKVTKAPDTVSEEDVNAEVEKLRDYYATFNAVDSPSEKDDMIVLDMETLIDNEPYEEWTKNDTNIKVGAGYFGEQFDIEVTGVKANDKKTFKVTYAQDFTQASVAGKSAEFTVTIKEVKRKDLPEFNDAFAAKVSDLKTGTELKERIQTGLQEERTKKSDEQLRQAIIDAVIGDIKVEVPNAMIETEVNRSLHEFEQQLSQSGVNLEKYAQMTGKTKDQLKDEIKPDAEKRVKADLALIQIAKKEKIDITDEDIEKLLTKWNMPDVKSRADLDANKQLDTGKVLEVIKKEKTYEFLVSKAKVS